MTDTASSQLFGDDWELLCETSFCEIAQLLFEPSGFISRNHPAFACQTEQKIAPCYDSRLLEAHHIFVALAGENFDGHNFIAQALDKGIRAIVFEPDRLTATKQNSLKKRIEQMQGKLFAFPVSNSRQALARLSAHCFGHPSRELEVLGITGTDGKTSIAYFCYQILLRCHQQSGSGGVGLLSTFGLDFGNGCLLPNPMHQTTPESLLVQRSLARMRANRCRFAVLECSSHGLSPRTARLLHTEFRAALFSNLSPEHLEFHGSLERYACDKARLFSGLKRDGIAVWNMQDGAAPMLYAESGARTDIVHLGYGLSEKKGSTQTKVPKAPELPQLPSLPIPFAQRFWAVELRQEPNGSHFALCCDVSPVSQGGKVPEMSPQTKIADCKISIPGSVYISNTLAALTLCQGVIGPANLPEMLQMLATPQRKPISDLLIFDLPLRAPTGRMELLESERGFSVLIDYAHSPGSFARLLPEMQALVAETGRLLVLFGSGGQRDRQKRFLQGALAARYADIILLCNEDPREEDEMNILQDIRSGIFGETGSIFKENQNLFLIPDRCCAMKQIFALARLKDMILLLGKGHENSMLLSGQRKIPWNERDLAQKLLKSS